MKSGRKEVSLRGGESTNQFWTFPTSALYRLPQRIGADFAKGNSKK